MKKLIYIAFILLGTIACNTEIVVNETTAVIETGVDADSWITIPAGTFNSKMIFHEDEIDYDYEMMLTHVTNAQYAKYLTEALAKGTIKIHEDSIMGDYKGEPFDEYLHEEEIPAGEKLQMPLSKAGTHISLVDNAFVVDEGFDNHPVINVTWFGANSYAEFYGYRLPTEREWEKAARGHEDTRAYAWGDEISSNITNFGSGKTALQRVVGGNVARTTPVGYYNGKTYGDFETEDNRSPYGLYDMGGNAWQWVGDDYANVHYRYMKGGSFTNYEYNLFVWARNSAGPSHNSINLGFRCARDVKVLEATTEAIVTDSTLVEEVEINPEN